MENRGAIATITLSENVMVSDPCYGMNTWCQGALHNVLPGKYNCFIHIADGGEWGALVTAIEVIHENYGDALVYASEPFEVGVDSGQAGIFDFDYYDIFHSDCSEREHVNSRWYEEVCNLSYGKDNGGIVDGRGLVSRSGYGDGGYECLTCKREDGKIVAIKIDYQCSETDEYVENYEEEEDEE